MKLKFIVTFLIFLVNPLFGVCQFPIINEILSSNEIYISDFEGDFPDWIELYNPTALPINLEGFRLSDDSSDLLKWAFPNTIINPDGHLLVLASGKDLIVETEIHTNFKLKSSGEKIYLSNADGELIDEILPVPLKKNQSYGRFVDNDERWVIQSTPTPMQPNNFSANIIPSTDSGIFLEPVILELESNQNLEIRYTLNGLDPDETSTMYPNFLELIELDDQGYSISSIPTTPLVGEPQLEDYKWKTPEYVRRAYSIKYAGFIDNLMVTQVYSKFYLIGNESFEHYDIPVVSMAIDSLSLFDYETGIYIPGLRFDQDGFNWFPFGNYSNTGDDWERIANLTFIKPSGQISFQSDVGIRMRGFGSAANPQKSLNIYFREEIGLDKIVAPVFPNDDSNYYKRLILRNSGQDFTKTHFRDALLHGVLREMKLESQDMEVVALFINGEYWGIHNLREKYDKRYLISKLDDSSVDVSILSVCGLEEEGSNDDFFELKEFLLNNDIENDDVYNEVKNQLDIQNFMDFIITEVYTANYDWPCNNFKIWKSNASDSKWRFMIYDLDASSGLDYLSLFDHKSLDHALSEENSWPYCTCSNFLFRTLIQNDSFKTEFISRFSDRLANILNPESMLARVDSVKTLYVSLMPEHISRWGYPESIEEWDDNIEDMEIFFANRYCFMIQHLKDYFSLEDIGISCDENFNTLELNVYPNPSNGELHLTSNAKSNIKGTFKIFDSSGQLCASYNELVLNPFQEFEFEFRDRNDGLYFLIFSSEEFSVSKRFVLLN